MPGAASLTERPKMGEIPQPLGGNTHGADIKNI